MIFSRIWQNVATIFKGSSGLGFKWNMFLCHSRVQVKVNSGISRNITVNHGITQGNPLSWIIFRLAISPLLQNLQQYSIPVKINNNDFTTQSYIDDMVQFMPKPQALSGNNNILTEYQFTSCVALNRDKTKILCLQWVSCSWISTVLYHTSKLTHIRYPMVTQYWSIYPINI